MSRESEVLDVMGKMLVDQHRAAKADMADFVAIGDEVMRYYSAKDYNFLYQDLPGDAFFRAKINKTFEAVAIMVPFFLPTLPHRQMHFKRAVSDPKRAHYDVVERYINWSVTESNYYQHTRRAARDLLTYGRGVMLTGIESRKELVTSRFVDVRNFFKDPSASVGGDENYVGITWELPRFQVIKMFPESAEIIKRLPTASVRQGDRNRSDTSSDCVRFHEIWMNTGLHNFSGGSQLLRSLRHAQAESSPIGQPGVDQQVEPSNDPLRYAVSEDGKLLHVGPWQAPYYVDNSWPVEWVEPYEGQDGAISPLEAGIGHQKAINWLVTLAMGRARHTFRTLMAVKTQNGQGLNADMIDRVMFGPDVEAISIDIKGETRSLKDFLEYFNPDDSWLNATIAFLNVLERKYEEATGLYSILFQGEGSHQDRSAAATQMKDRNSRHRIEDIREQVLNWQGRIARKEALATQFLKNRQDMAQIFGEEAGQAYGFLAPQGFDPQQRAQQLMAAGLIPEQAVQQAMIEAEQAYTVNDVINEADYSIEPGSQLRRDINHKIDVLTRMQDNTLATMMQSHDPYDRAIAFDTSAELFQTIGGDDRLIDQYRQQADRLRMIGQLQDQQMLAPPAPGGEEAPA